MISLYKVMGMVLASRVSGCFFDEFIHVYG